MPGKRTKPPEHQHEGKGGRVFQEHGKSPSGGKAKGHDLLNSDSSTAGVGSSIRSPAEAKRIDEARGNPPELADQDLEVEGP